MKKSVLCIASCLFCMNLLYAGEFEVDEHTLFLAHFDGGIDADYARGNKKAGGYANIDPNGKFGGALSAKSGPMVMVDNYPRGYCPIGFEVKDNLNLKTGTFEMWVKTTFDPKRNPKNYAGWAFYRFLQIRKKQKTEDKKDIYKLLFFVTERDYKPEARVLNLFVDVGNKRRITASVWDKHDKWTHYAITWDEGRISYFINGSRIGKTFENPNGMLYLNPDIENDKFYIGGNVIEDFKGSDSGSCANSLIDEVRISDIVRYKENFEVL